MLDQLQRKVAVQAPDFAGDNLIRLMLQYEMQSLTHQSYALQPYDGSVLLIEPESKYAGILAAQLNPYVKSLRSKRIAIGTPTEQVLKLDRYFGNLGIHYRSMRDDVFVDGAANVLRQELI